MNWCESVGSWMPSSLIPRHVLGMVAFCWLALNLGADPVTALVFSPDGSSVIYNSDGQLAIRSTSDPGANVSRRVPTEMPKIKSLCFSSDGRRLAVAGGTPGVSGELRILSWPEAATLHHLTSHSDVLNQVSFDQDGVSLGVASSDGLATLWRLADGKEPRCTLTLKGHAGPVLAIAFSPSEQTIVTAGADRSLKVWSRVDGQLIRSLGHHTEPIHALAMHPVSSMDPGEPPPPILCASAGEDRTVRIWQPEIGRMVRIIRRHDGSVFCLAWSPDCQALYSAGREGIVRKLDGRSDAILAEWPTHSDWIYALAISPKGNLLASGDWHGQVKLRQLP